LTAPPDNPAYRPGARRAYHLARLLRQRPADAKYARRYLRSLATHRSPVLDAIPWIPFRAADFLADRVETSWSVFEYGSGGTTTFLASRAGSIHTVEHDPTWYTDTAAVLNDAGLEQVRYELVEPEPGSPADRGDQFASTSYAGFNFERYVKTIDVHEEGSLDLVVVDGRARVSCVRRALPKLRPGGYLLLDNSDRDEYQPALEQMAGHRLTDLEGLTPYLLDLSKSSVCQIARRR
jgi:hypothetical protein